MQFPTGEQIVINRKPEFELQDADDEVIKP